MSGEFAGTLDQQVTAMRQAANRDAGGGADGGWTVLAVLPAALAPDGTGPAVAGDTLAARPRWRVTLRPADIAVGDRLGWRGTTFSVRAVLADPRQPDRVELSCEEVA